MARGSSIAFEHMIDHGSFRPHKDELETRDPLAFPNYRASVAEEVEQSGVDESVATGSAAIGGHPVELACFNFDFLGGSMGEVAGERLAQAMERAAQRGVPFVLRTATGGARMQEGMNALVQMPKVVVARFALAEANQPYIVVFGDPTTGGVLASVGALADITIAEAGATVGFAGPRVVEMITGAAPSSASHSAQSASGYGLIDAVVDKTEVTEFLARTLSVLAPDEPEDVGKPREAEPSADDGWDATEKARAENRPTAPALLRSLLTDAAPLRGDRAGAEEHALVAALGRMRGRRVLALALDRERLPRPADYRLARRALRVADRLRIPVVTLIDTRGADPSERSESGGVAWEIAQLFAALLVTEVPVVAVVTGEGGSGGALAFAVGDVLLAYEHTIFSVIGPEGAATILWRDPARAPDAARTLKLTASDLVSFGIADALLSEPPDAGQLADAVAYHHDRLRSMTGHELVVARMKRWRRADGRG